jgi:hypothetical protein
VNSTEQGPLRCAKAARSKSNAGSGPSNCSVYTRTYTCCTVQITEYHQHQHTQAVHESCAERYAAHSDNLCAGVRRSEAVHAHSKPHSMRTRMIQQPGKACASVIEAIAQLTLLNTEHYCGLCMNVCIILKAAVVHTCMS